MGIGHLAQLRSVYLLDIKVLFYFYFHRIHFRSTVFLTGNAVFLYRNYYSPFEEIFCLLLAPTS